MNQAWFATAALGLGVGIVGLFIQRLESKRRKERLTLPDKLAQKEKP